MFYATINYHSASNIVNSFTNAFKYSIIHDNSRRITLNNKPYSLY